MSPLLAFLAGVGVTVAAVLIGLWFLIRWGASE